MSTAPTRRSSAGSLGNKDATRSTAFESPADALREVQSTQAPAMSGRKSALLFRGQIFENKAVARTESNENPSEEMPEEFNHGKNLIETYRLGLVSKSLILRVHEVLTRDKITASAANTFRIARYPVPIHQILFSLALMVSSSVA
jgi:hypothetical protein